MPKVARDPLERIEEQVVRLPFSGCWIWTGATRSGYGRMFVGSRSDGSRKAVSTHRFFYEFAVGGVPDGMDLDHLCRVRCCLNPQHLEAVTRKENILRGVGMGARNSKKTHCPKGHEYTPENVLGASRGIRACRLCKQAGWLKYYREVTGQERKT
jgi:hypothetical protein